MAQRFSKWMGSYLASVGALLFVSVGCTQSAAPSLQASELQTGAPIAGAIIVLSMSKRPFLGSLFSSADPSRCTRLGFVKTDAAGRFTPIKGMYPSALIAAGFVGLSQVDTIPDQGGFVMRQQYLQSSEESEAFGLEYASEAEANQARLSFLASAEGQNYTAFTVRPPDSQFKNFRMLVVKYVEVARSTQRFATQAEADIAWRSTAYAIKGGFDAKLVLDVLASCQSVKATQPELGVLVLRAIEAALPADKRTATQAEYVRNFAKQLDATIAP
jgi:hypothetical protein